MKQGPYKNKNGKLHRHGRPKRKSLNVNHNLAAMRYHTQWAKYP